MTTKLDYESLRQPIEAVASKVSRQFFSTVERDDLEGELWAFCVEQEAALTRYAQAGDLDKVIRTALYRKAYEYANKEREAKMGPDSVQYTPAVVKALLPDCFDPEDWQSSAVDYGREVRGHEPVNRRGDRLAGILDVRSALTQIDGHEYWILQHHYQLGIQTEAIALLDPDNCGPNPVGGSAYRKRIDRIVKALCTHLNSPRQYVNPHEAVNGQFDSRSKWRHAQTNAASRATTSTYWDE